MPPPTNPAGQARGGLLNSPRFNQPLGSTLLVQGTESTLYKVVSVPGQTCRRNDTHEMWNTDFEALGLSNYSAIECTSNARACKLQECLTLSCMQRDCSGRAIKPTWSEA